MGLKTFVKINSVTNLSDARYCAAMGVDQIGFCLASSNKNYVSPKIIEEIIGWISGIEIVSELDNEQELLLTEIIEVNSLPNDIHTNKRVIINITLDEAETKLEQLNEVANLEHVIISSNELIDDNLLKRIHSLSEKIPVLLGFGLNANNINHVLNSTSIKGIALSGSSEIRPGYKDYDELGDILEAIEID